MTEPLATPNPTTPKRKRDQDLPMYPIYTTSTFSFQLTDAKNDEDGSGSPHSKVVQKFRGLALNCGGGGALQQQNPKEPHDLACEGFQDGYRDNPFATRKRIKIPDLEMNNTGADATEPTIVPHPEIKSDSDPIAKSGLVTISPITTTEEILQPIAMNTAGSNLSHSLLSIDRLRDPGSKERRRAVTPLPMGRKEKIAGTLDEDQGMKIVDPIRAALTWKDEEITMYDPEDADDDGTGINGVGFMPTAAMAYARNQKRRLQLAEYKKREENEARARRSQRRGGSVGALGSKLDSQTSCNRGSGVRRVRFREVEHNPVVTNV